MNIEKDTIKDISEIISVLMLILSGIMFIVLVCVDAIPEQYRMACLFAGCMIIVIGNKIPEIGKNDNSV